MSSSGSDFDDDDDELLQALINGETTVATNNGERIALTNANLNKQNLLTGQAGVNTQGGNKAQAGNKTQHSHINQLLNANPDGPTNFQSQLYRADGEIAILRAQLEQLQHQKVNEVSKLKEVHDLYKRNNEDQVSALKFAVQKLEDEKKFLNNELKTSTKRRKVHSTPTQSSSGIDIDLSTSASQTTQKENIPPINNVANATKLQNDSSLYIDQLWNHCILGSKRTSLTYLNKVCIDFDFETNDFKVVRRTPLSSGIIEFLMLNKNLRLDQLIKRFCLHLVEVIDVLLKEKSIVSIPFLLSLVHFSVSYRPAAIGTETIKSLLIKFSRISNGLAFLLHNEQDIINYHDVPDQIMIIEKFIFICCLDIIEKLVSLSSLSDDKFIRSIWTDEILSVELLGRCLPENTERFKNSAQINLVYNFVEMLISSITEETFAYNDQAVSDSIIFSSLLKIFLIEVPIKDDFMFYGLNRIIGNNLDFAKIDSTIPQTKDKLNNFTILTPQPIPFELLKQNQTNKEISFELESNHEFHVLNLRIKVANLLESYIVTKQSVSFLQQKEHFKSIIRIIGFEQVHIQQAPRSKHVNLRIQIISILIKVVNYLTQEMREMSSLIYPETMYELYVVLLRIAFGSDSLSVEAHRLLVEVRNKRFINDTIFNGWCEHRARELNHLTHNDLQGKLLADIESDYANGLEFPYESDTVELAREILNVFVTHEEADNLYFNMNHQEDDGNFDEMDLIE